MKDRVIIMKGKKVSLVVPEKEDVDYWYKSINNLEINKYLLSGTVLYSYEFEQKYYEDTALDVNNIKFSIYLNKEKRIIGVIDFQKLSHFHKTSYFGIFLGEEKTHGKGYGTEAITLFLDYAFRIQGLRKICLGYLSGNEKGKHVYEKIGFKEVGKFKDQFFKNGTYHDEVLMEIFKEEFYNKNTL